jgi:selenocysteine lyase/cysteine desulfurase
MQPTSTIAPRHQRALRLVGEHQLVPSIDGSERLSINLDHAASTPALAEVHEAVERFVPWYSSIHRGAGYRSQVASRAYEGARAAVADFVDADDDQVVVLVRNTTEALNVLASAVAPGRRVLCSSMEHHANLLPWRAHDLEMLPFADSPDELLETCAATLSRAHPRAFDLLVVTAASNVTGELWPIRELAALAHAYGARIVVDGAQLAPHRPISLRELGVDYLALSGHKLYAPYGAGVLVGRRDWLDAAPPHLAGGGAVRRVTDTATEWAAAPHRHEGGTPNVLGAAALAQACRTLAPVLGDAAAAHERNLLNRLETGLAGIPGVEVLRIWPDSPDRIAVVSFVVADRPAGYVAAYLSAEHGIGLRDGKFCAHPLLERLCPGGEALRASIGLGSTAEDIDRLLAALRTLVTSGASWTYAPVDGRWAPTPDPRDLDPFGIGRASGAGARCQP